MSRMQSSSQPAFSRSSGRRARSVAFVFVLGTDEAGEPTGPPQGIYTVDVESGAITRLSP